VHIKNNGHRCKTGGPRSRVHVCTEIHARGEKRPSNLHFDGVVRSHENGRTTSLSNKKYIYGCVRYIIYIFTIIKAELVFLEGCDWNFTSLPNTKILQKIHGGLAVLEGGDWELAHRIVEEELGLISGTKGGSFRSRPPRLTLSFFRAS